jgi:hypothetical protein
MRVTARPARAAFSSSVGLILHLRVRSSAIRLRISYGGPNDTFDAAFGANTGTHRKSLIRDTENVKKWKKGLVEGSADLPWAGGRWNDGKGRHHRL